MLIVNFLTIRYTFCHTVSSKGCFERKKEGETLSTNGIKCHRLSGAYQTGKNDRKKETGQGETTGGKNSKLRNQPMQICQENSFGPHFVIGRDKLISIFV